MDLIGIKKRLSFATNTDLFDAHYINDMNSLIATVESLQKENEQLRHRDRVVSLTNETLARYVNEGKEEISSLNERNGLLISTGNLAFQTAAEEIDALNNKISAYVDLIKALPEKLLQIDCWADTEELNFPIPAELATEDAQNEWFERFCTMQGDYVHGVIGDALLELEVNRLKELLVNNG